MEKIKAWIQSETGKDVLTIIIVILVGLGSFELGRLSKGSTSSGIKIEYPDKGLGESANTISAITAPTTNHTTPSAPAGKEFFASSRGTRYYSFGCSAGKTIKTENRVYFSSANAAETAGYTLSTSCK